MLSNETMLAFLGASVLVTLAPGPDNLFVLAQGMSRGRKAALLAAWGMCSGVALHTLAAALGVSALIRASSWAFGGLQLAGAGYLFYLAYLEVRDRGRALGSVVGGVERSGFAQFRKGFLMNVLNPKVGLFFLAFLPQFIDPGSESQALAMLVLGALFMIQALMLFSGLAWFSGTIGGLLGRSQRGGRVLSLLAAGVFFVLGLRLVLELV